MFFTKDSGGVYGLFGGRYLSPRVEQGLVHVTDWFPTLLSAAGLAPSKDDLDGIDQWEALIDASTASPRKEMVYNIRHQGGKYPISCAIVS